MDMIQLLTNQMVGTTAFFVGVVLLLIELIRHGLSKLSIFSYACFVLSSIFLSNSLLMCVIAVLGLSVLFGILLICYRRECKRQKNTPNISNDVSNENEDKK